MPRLVALTCGAKALAGLRAAPPRASGGGSSEIGFGSGFNVPHYPPEVDAVCARGAVRHRLPDGGPAARTSPVPCARSARRSGPARSTTPAATPPCARSSSAPSPTWRRAGRGPPGPPTGRPVPLPRARAAPDARVEAFQHRVEPLQRRVADGCHLTRDPSPSSMRRLQAREVGQGYGAGPRAWSYLTRAVTVRRDRTSGGLAARVAELEQRLDAAESVLALHELKAGTANWSTPRFSGGGGRARGPRRRRRAGRRALHRGRGLGRRSGARCWRGASPRSPPDWPRPRSSSPGTSS